MGAGNRPSIPQASELCLLPECPFQTRTAIPFGGSSKKNRVVAAQGEASDGSDQRTDLFLEARRSCTNQGWATSFGLRQPLDGYNKKGACLHATRTETSAFYNSNE